MGFSSRVHLVLRHDEVLGRKGEPIHASVTQVDLHDLCRLALTYGLGAVHCVTAVASQHKLCADMAAFWRRGSGRDHNPDRNRALEMLSLHHSFSAAAAAVRLAHGKAPLLLGTSARPHHKNLDFRDLPSIIGRSGRPAVIQFGTAWGLSPEQLDRCDWVLPPIDGYDGYNHLSVRCAAAIIVDRIFTGTSIQTGANEHGYHPAVGK